MTLLIYLEQRTSRSDYIFTHIFTYVLGLPIRFTTDSQIFIKSELPKINYSKQSFSNELFFYSSDILFEDTVQNQNLTYTTYNDILVFFLCDKGVLPFDPFASSFYMLSRYEEYLANKKDKIGRFLAKESLLFQHNSLTIPVVDHWILFIKNQLINRFSNLKFKKHNFQFINTIDIDNAYAYLEKNFLRTFLSSVLDFFMFNFKNMNVRMKVLFFNKKDPYDTYDRLLEIHEKYNLNTIFFFLLADYSRYDRNVSFSSSRLKKLIKKINSVCKLGIHASFSSIKYPKKLSIEIERLEKIIDYDVLLSRQHFIHLNLPYNYRNLIENGITHDYSMGFPSLPGFRAGTSYNFYFFDLLDNLSTNLLVHPFSIMDVTFRNYLNLNPLDSQKIIKDIICNIKNVNGTFISIWHNESLINEDRWLNWDIVYENMIKYIYNAID